jgi:hypothetical protein
MVAIVQDAQARADDDACMKTFTVITVGRAARHPLWRVARALATTAARLRAGWQRARLDNDTRYLSSAVDHADLERRLRAIDRCHRSSSC